MKPMFLPDVENNPNIPGPYAKAIEQMRSSGLAVPQILYLIAYKPEVTGHLLRLTQAVMRGPSPLSPGDAGADRRVHVEAESVSVLN